MIPTIATQAISNPQKQAQVIESTVAVPGRTIARQLTRTGTRLNETNAYKTLTQDPPTAVLARHLLLVAMQEPAKHDPVLQTPTVKSLNWAVQQALPISPQSMLEHPHVTGGDLGVGVGVGVGTGVGAGGTGAGAGGGGLGPPYEPGGGGVTVGGGLPEDPKLVAQKPATDRRPGPQGALGAPHTGCKRPPHFWQTLKPLRHTRPALSHFEPAQQGSSSPPHTPGGFCATVTVLGPADVSVLTKAPLLVLVEIETFGLPDVVTVGEEEVVVVVAWRFRAMPDVASAFSAPAVKARTATANRNIG